MEFDLLTFAAAPIYILLSSPIYHSLLSSYLVIYFSYILCRYIGRFASYFVVLTFCMVDSDWGISLLVCLFPEKGSL